MQSSTLNIVQSLSTAGASRVQIGNTYNTTNHYQRDIDHENKKLLEALRSTDPRQDKVRIEQTNNHLLRESYMWILENPDFLAWQDATHGSRLWIRGDPGKGKTMLLCGIIDELLPSTRLGNPESQISLSYFFCQAANPGLSNSTAVLEGLTYLLLVQQPCLLSHLQDAPQYNPSHWNSRRDIEGLFCRIVSDPAIQEMYLIVDALDECVRDVPFLLEIISRPNPRIKWIISSRNRCEIEKDLERSPSKIELSLELCQGSISQAVRHFINYRTCQVVKRQKLKYDVAQRIQRYLIQNAQDTFLWVALVCERLERCQSWEVSKQLLQFPKGLSKLYERMIEEIRISDSRELYIRLLAMALTVFRPLTFSELLAMEQLEANGTLMDENILANVIKECGSFLTSKEKTIIFIHQSAREYLNKESIMLLYPSGLAHYHYTIFRRSIDILEVLRKDIYNLKHPGTSLDVAIRNRPDHDPLRSLTYALVFWHDHIREAYELSTRENTEVEIPFVEIVYGFLSKKFLLWLEALSLCHNLSVAGKTLLSLRDIPAIISHSDAPALIEDAIRFLLLFSPVIEDYPLQAYASGLLFSPQKSIIRRLFKQYTPEFIATGPRVEENWSPILSVFETPSGTEIRTIIFSSTSNMLAMTMSDSQLLIRNVGDGSVLRRSKYENATLLTPSPDLRCLASIITRYSVDTQELIQDTLEVRDIDSNNILWTRTLDGREALVMGLSPDGKWLAVCYREELHVFTHKGELVQSWGLELGPHILCQDQIPWYLNFSSDCAMLLLRYYAGGYSMLAFDIQTSMQYKSPEVRNTPSNQEIWFGSVEDAKFIPGTHQVMLCVAELGIYTWDFLKGECEEFFECGDSFSCIALSHAEVFTQACEFLSLWDRHEKSPLQDFKLPRNDDFKEIQVSYDGKHVAVCSSTTVWLVEVDAILDDKPRSGKQKDMIPHISSNGTSIAYHDYKNAIEIHNQRTGVFKNTLDIKGKVRGSVHSVAFSPDGQLFAFSDDSFLNIWDLSQGSLRHSLEIPARAKSIAISGESADGQWVAVCTAFEVLTWDVNKGQLQRSIQSPGSLDRHPYGACFAGTRLGVSWYYSPFQSIGSIPHEIFVLYDIKTGQHLSKLNLPCSWDFLGAPGGRISVSPNGKWVVSFVFKCRRLLLSDVEKGIQYAVIDVNATWFSFTDDVTLFTEKGVIHLDHIVDDATVISERDRSQTVEIDNGFGLELPVVMPIFGKYRCSAHCEWITINDSPLLWLPKQYRFGTQEYSGEMAIGYHYVTMDSFSGLYYIRFAEDAGENF